jgi:hypothetical protein
MSASTITTDLASANSHLDSVDSIIAGWISSYGRQMKDQDMIHMAQRILDRAVRRGGEFLAQMKGAQGKRTDLMHHGASSSSRKEMAKEAGLSPSQAKTMLRVANVPEATFERMVEGKSPASVKQLADEGTRKRKAVIEPHREEYLDWCHAVRHLAALPACGLGVLASRGPYTTAELIDECDDAIRNLKLPRARPTPLDALIGEARIISDNPNSAPSVAHTMLGAHFIRKIEANNEIKIQLIADGLNAAIRRFLKEDCDTGEGISKDQVDLWPKPVGGVPQGAERNRLRRGAQRCDRIPLGEQRKRSVARIGG